MWVTCRQRRATTTLATLSTGTVFLPTPLFCPIPIFNQAEWLDHLMPRLLHQERRLNQRNHPTLRLLNQANQSDHPTPWLHNQTRQMDHPTPLLLNRTVQLDHPVPWLLNLAYHPCHLTPWLLSHRHRLLLLRLPTLTPSWTRTLQPHPTRNRLLSFTK